MAISARVGGWLHLSCWSAIACVAAWLRGSETETQGQKRPQHCTSILVPTPPRHMLPGGCTHISNSFVCVGACCVLCACCSDCVLAGRARRRPRAKEERRAAASGTRGGTRSTRASTSTEPARPVIPGAALLVLCGGLQSLSAALHPFSSSLRHLLQKSITVEINMCKRWGQACSD